MNKEKDTVFWKWGGSIILLGIMSFFVWAGVREYRFSRNHRFTIARTLGYGGGGFVQYEFEVNGVTYTRGDRGKQLIINGRRYFVKYYAPDPSYLAKVVSNQEVPECIGEPPSDGWPEIPTCK